MLRFEPVAFHDDVDAHYGAVIVTSANALRGIEAHLAGSRLLKLPLFAVGEHTAAAARRAGFDNVIAAEGDAIRLARCRARRGEGKAAEEGQHAALSRGRRSGARPGRRTRRARFYRRHPYDLPDDPGIEPAARSLRRLRGQPDRGGAALFAAQRAAPSSRPRARPASKSRRWRSRNAAFPMPWPPFSAMPGPRRSWWRLRRMKMPCSRRWTVRCGPDRATRRPGVKSRSGRDPVRIAGSCRETLLNQAVGPMVPITTCRIPVLSALLQRNRRDER